MNAGGGGGHVGGDNLDDFDFGDSGKAQQKGGNEEFNFNFGADEKKEEQKMNIEPSAQIGNLLDLDFNAPPSQPPA